MTKGSVNDFQGPKVQLPPSGHRLDVRGPSDGTSLMHPTWGKTFDTSDQPVSVRPWSETFLDAVQLQYEQQVAAKEAKEQLRNQPAANPSWSDFMEFVNSTRNTIKAQNPKA